MKHFLKLLSKKVEAGVEPAFLLVFWNFFMHPAASSHSTSLRRTLVQFLLYSTTENLQQRSLKYGILNFAH